jgi:hypothetical protein
MASMSVDAVLSANGKYAVCGACGEPLCRRDRRAAEPQWNAGRAYIHVLVWGPEWRLVPALDDEPAYLTRDASSDRRFALGNAPVRGRPGDWVGAAYYVSYTVAPLARCRCGATNRADPKTLHVQAAP